MSFVPRRPAIQTAILLVALAGLAACGGGDDTRGPSTGPDGSSTDARAGVGADASLICGAAERDCAGACVACPDLGPTTCQDDACVLDADGCGQDERPCRDGCCAWRSEAVAVGTSPDLALTPDGEPIVVYLTDDELSLATHREEGWQTEPITVLGQARTGRYPSLAIAPDGTLHIAFARRVGGTNEVVHLKRAVGAAWIETTLGTEPGTFVSGARVALAPGGEPWVLYQGPRGLGNLVVYHAHDGGWVREIVDASRPANRAPDLVFDGSGRPLLAYARALDQGAPVVVASREGDGSWQTTVVDDRTGVIAVDPSLSLDASDRVSVLYGDSGSEPALRWSEASGDGFAFEPLVTGIDEAWTSVLRRDESDRPHGLASYLGGPFDPAGDDLGYLVRLGEVFWQSRVASGTTTIDADLELGPGGDPHVVYGRSVDDVDQIFYAH